MSAETKTVLPAESAARKAIPLTSGVLDYFPAALAAVAEVSKAGNDKHNPGEPLHWSRGKSGDHADCIARHLVDRGTVDPEDGLRHSAKAAWRALALLQEELEAAGAPLARGASVTEDAPEDGCTIRCDSCESTQPYVPAPRDEIVATIRAGDRDRLPCDNIRCAGHLRCV
jgi:hypothetical protein